MAPIQDTIGSTYPTRTTSGYAGMLADGSLNDAQSKIVETAAIAFGLAVGRGTADNSVKLGGAGFEGIAMADKTRTADSYAVGEYAAIAKKGVIWATAGASVTPADTVYFAAATGVISNISAGGTAITGAKFLDTAASGALVRVYLP